MMLADYLLLFQKGFKAKQAYDEKLIRYKFIHVQALRHIFRLSDTTAKVGNDADSLLGQADGVEVGNLVGFLTLLYTIGRMVVRTY